MNYNWSYQVSNLLFKPIARITMWQNFYILQNTNLLTHNIGMETTTKVGLMLARLIT